MRLHIPYHLEQQQVKEMVYWLNERGYGNGQRPVHLLHERDYMSLEIDEDDILVFKLTFGL